MEVSSAELVELDDVVYISSPQLLNESGAGGGGGGRAGGGGAGSLELGRRLLGAARRGDSAAVLQLMAAGAPFTADWLGTSALHAAAAGDHAATCAVLLRAGVSRDARTKVERTPLHVAAAAGHAAVARLLLERGAAVDARDMLRMTPLHWAAERGHADVAAALLAHGADPAARSKFHKTPLQLAAARQHRAVLGLLEEAARRRPPPAAPATPAPAIPAAEQQQALDSIQGESPRAADRDNTSVKIELPPEPAGKENTPVERGAAGGGEAAALLRRHGITLLPPDSSSTVLNAIQSGRTVVLSDAGKLMLKDTPSAAGGGGAGGAAGAGSAGSKGVVLTAAAVRAPPAPGVKIFTLNNKRAPAAADSADMQIKLVPAAGAARRVVRARRPARPGAAPGTPLKIILQKPSADRPAPAGEGGAGAGAGGAADYVCVPAEFLSSSSPAYLRAQLLAAHTTIHELRQRLAALQDQLAARTHQHNTLNTNNK